MQDNPVSPFAIANVRRFIWFRIFFNGRFYYPVFAILFLDFGLTLSQFALLNVIWAVTIVLFEVPSGALADTVGRRNLVVAASVLMVLEMLLLIFAPQGMPALMFAFFVVNRILSGLAEAAASGADEALAYDSLKAAGLEACWGQVLEKQMRTQSIAFIVAMSLGAFVYDPDLINGIFSLLGMANRVSQQDTLLMPVYLTLLMAVLAVTTTLGMREVNGNDKPEHSASPKPGISQAFALTIVAGKWILTTPLSLCLILSGLMFDHIIRMVLTLNSQYYRMIDLPEASFGLIGAGIAILGLLVPALARIAAERISIFSNFLIMCALCFVALAGMAFLIPYWGLVPALLTMVVMIMNNYMLSHHLHRITESHQRATVLSFRGLSYNLGYGALGLLYAALIAALEKSQSLQTMALNEADTADWTFAQSLLWFPGYFVLFALILSVFSYIYLKHKGRQQVTAKPA